MTTNADRTPSKVPEITLLFWILKVAATTLGETGGDAVTLSLDLGYLAATAIFADRSLGIGHVGGSALLFALTATTLALWHRAEGSVSVDTVSGSPTPTASCCSGRPSW